MSTEGPHECPNRCPDYSEYSDSSEYSERKKEGPTVKCRTFNVSLSLGKLMLYQLSYSRFRYADHSMCWQWMAEHQHVPPNSRWAASEHLAPYLLRR
jgi:hypothetical protein